MIGQYIKGAFLSPKKTFTSFYRKAARRKMVMIAFTGLLLWSMGAAPLLVWTALSAPVSQKNLRSRNVASLPTATKSISPIVPSIVSTPRVADTPPIDPPLPPIAPFPVNMQQQIALMQAKDRFFYHGNLQLPEVALTFDDGPDPRHTTAILNILRHYQIHATFFAIGQHVVVYPNLVRQEYLAGNDVGDHTWSHPFLPNVAENDIGQQITSTANAIKQCTGKTPTYFRAPYGAISPQVLSQVNKLGMRIFQWNVDPQDWSQPGRDAIIARVTSHAGSGAIILMHDGGGDRSQTIAALPTIIERLQARGLHFVTLREMIEHLHGKSAGNTMQMSAPNQRFWYITNDMDMIDDTQTRSIL